MLLPHANKIGGHATLIMLFSEYNLSLANWNLLRFTCVPNLKCMSILEDGKEFP